MFASLLMAALVQTIVVPLYKDHPKADRPIAPIETAGPAFAVACNGSEDWDKPAPPVRIHGNTYLVGTCGISSILITGSDGHVLIDGGTEAGADVIANNVRRLGFKLTDIKYLLHSHEHFDHVGGIARLQQLTGAQLLASPEAAKVFATGAAGVGDPQAGMHPPFRSAHVDRVLTDGEVVRLGGVALTSITTPGHTPGALSWQWVSCDGGVCRTIVYADSLSPISSDKYRFIDHPAYVAAFRAGIRKVAALECDILLTPHPSASNMPDRMLGKAPLENPAACRDYAAAKTKDLDARLAKEGAK
ncbi:MAG: subclass B3 metallo-beta-lactamase [Sphingomicrobium sp.]